MRPEDLREFASRDYQRVARAKLARWKQRRATRGPGEGFRLAADLYDHVSRTRRDGASAESRRADLAHHIELSRRLGAVTRR